VQRLKQKKRDITKWFLFYRLRPEGQGRVNALSQRFSPGQSARGEPLGNLWIPLRYVRGFVLVNREIVEFHVRTVRID
jgi:hypothetical protein